jgi:hypothetical protein
MVSGDNALGLELTHSLLSSPTLGGRGTLVPTVRVCERYDLVDVRHRVGDVFRPWRVRRYRREQLLRRQEDQRREEHAERLRQGIKDTPPAVGGA